MTNTPWRDPPRLTSRTTATRRRSRAPERRRSSCSPACSRTWYLATSLPPGMSGIELLKRIREFDPVLPVVMVTAYGTIEGAVEAVKLGAFDYVKKPVDLEELKLLAERARADRLLKQELSYYRQRATPEAGVAGMIGA